MSSMKNTGKQRYRHLIKHWFAVWAVFIDFHPQIKMLSTAGPQPATNDVKLCLENFPKWLFQTFGYSRSIISPLLYHSLSGVKTLQKCLQKKFVEIRKQGIYDTSLQPQFILPSACVSCWKLQLQDLALWFFTNPLQLLEAKRKGLTNQSTSECRQGVEADGKDHTCITGCLAWPD